jgi:Gpi18-like mannosyltransferase
MNSKWKESDLLFVISIWLSSRLLVLIGMQLIAPSLHFSPISFDEPELDTLQIKNFLPQSGWELFTHWDGEHYRNIVTKGYTYVTSNKQNNIAFFPIYPLVVWLFVSMGIPFDIAGTILSNVAFLVALLIFYKWISGQYSQSIARWATAVMTWFPLSLFCSLTYTESFFLLFTIVALSTFEKRQYAWATGFGILATATRSPGMVLIPTFLLAAYLERRPLIAYLSALATGGGIIIFSLFCWIKFDDPFAFIRAQSGWPQPNWFELLRDIVMPLFTGNFPFYLQIIIISLITAMGVIAFYKPRWKHLGIGILGIPLVASFTSLLQISLPPISIWLMWNLRNQLNRILLLYGWCSLGFLFLSGTKMSIHRHIYVIIPMSLILGIVFSRHPRSGYIAIGSFGLLLLVYSIRFAWWDWIG